MKRLFAVAAFLLASTAAQAQYTFEYGGRTIRIDPDRGTVSIPGVYDNSGRRTKRSHSDQDSDRQRKQAPEQAKIDPQPPRRAGAPAARHRPNRRLRPHALHPNLRPPPRMSRLRIPPRQPSPRRPSRPRRRFSRTLPRPPSLRRLRSSRRRPPPHPRPCPQPRSFSRPIRRSACG